jgi:hypothetical protein
MIKILQKMQYFYKNCKIKIGMVVLCIYAVDAAGPILSSNHISKIPDDLIPNTYPSRPQ